MAKTGRGFPGGLPSGKLARLGMAIYVRRILASSMRSSNNQNPRPAAPGRGAGAPQAARERQEAAPSRRSVPFRGTGRHPGVKMNLGEGEHRRRQSGTAWIYVDPNDDKVI